MGFKCLKIKVLARDRIQVRGLRRSLVREPLLGQVRERGRRFLLRNTLMRLQELFPELDQAPRRIQVQELDRVQVRAHPLEGWIRMIRSKVTVVIPFYNPGNYLIQAVESVFSQTYEGWSIILVDDASTDHSASHLQRYLSDSRVTLVRHEQNLGQSHSLNTALKHVNTPYFVQLDGDDWLYPHSLEVLIHAADQTDDTFSVYGGNANIVVEDAQGARMMNYVRRGRFFKDRYDFLLSNLSLWPRMYRTEKVNEAGGWPVDDPFAGRYLEDRQLLLRLIENSTFYWIDQTLYHYRRHANNKTNDIPRMAATMDWVARAALKRWGDLYEPVYTTYGPGWIKVKELVPKAAQAAQQTAPPPVQPPAASVQAAPAPRTYKPGTGPNTGPGTGPYTGPGTAPGTGPGT